MYFYEMLSTHSWPLSWYTPGRTLSYPFGAFALCHEAFDKRSQATGELMAPPDLPHLPLVARLYHGVEATSCQAERNFSSLSFLIGTLRASMSPFKVEQMMFLKLN